MRPTGTLIDGWRCRPKYMATAEKVKTLSLLGISHFVSCGAPCATCDCGSATAVFGTVKSRIVVRSFPANLQEVSHA